MNENEISQKIIEPYINFLRDLCVFQMKVRTLRSLRLNLFLFVFFFFFLASFSQEGNIAEIIATAAEELAAYENEPLLAEEYSDMLYELFADRVEINSGDEAEIRRLFFLSEFMIKILHDYIKKNGAVSSMAEIANIPGFDRETAELMTPFITLTIHKDNSADTPGLRSSILANLIVKGSSENKSAPGSQLKTLLRYKFSAGGFSGGFTAEKDPYEKLFYADQPSPDFLSGYFSYSGNGMLKRVVAGDFSARFGLGTSLNTGLRTGFSLTAPGNLTGRNEIRPYTSTDENNFFRGLAVVIGRNNLEITAFLSSNYIDATLNEQTDSAELSVKSLFRTGYHDTGSSVRKKDVLKETSSGANLSYNRRNLKTGFTLTRSQFSLPFRPDTNDPGSIYNFGGTCNTVYSIYYSRVVKKILMSGELSSSDMDGYALVQTLTFRPAGRLSVNILYRFYSPGYITFHGRGPGIGTTTNNEDGIGGGFTFEAAKYLFLSAGTDIRNFTWLRYRVSFPSLSRRHELRIKYLPSQIFNLEAHYSFRSSLTDGLNENGIPLPAESVTRSLRIAAKFNPSDVMTFSTRIDFKDAILTGSHGILLLQDFVIRLREIPLSLWMRFGIFNTGDYESGIYTYENDLLNSFSIPVLYGKGTRSYLMIKWEPLDKIELRVKYGITSVSRRDITDEFNDELKLQLNLRF